MKRLKVFLFIGMMLSMSSCTASKDLNDGGSTAETSVYDKYKMYDNGHGLSVYLAKDMTENDVEGMTMFFSNDHCMFSAVREDFILFREAGISTDDLTIEEYADLVEDGNGNTISFEKDEKDHLSVVYRKTIDGNEITYYSTIRLGTDAGWTISFACLSSEEKTYLPLFELWADSIEVS